MNRLIREEDVQRILTKTELSGGNFTEAKIAVRDNIETAYDVEAVVAELNDYAMWKEFMIYDLKYRERKILEKAIEIVERGGRKGEGK